MASVFLLYQGLEVDLQEFKILACYGAWRTPDFERRGAARSGFWGLLRGIIQILSTILASMGPLARRRGGCTCGREYRYTRLHVWPRILAKIRAGTE